MNTQEFNPASYLIDSLGAYVFASSKNKIRANVDEWMVNTRNKYSNDAYIKELEDDLVHLTLESQGMVYAATKYLTEGWEGVLTITIGDLNSKIAQAILTFMRTDRDMDIMVKLLPNTVSEAGTKFADPLANYHLDILRIGHSNFGKPANSDLFLPLHSIKFSSNPVVYTQELERSVRYAFVRHSVTSDILTVLLYDKDLEGAGWAWKDYHSDQYVSECIDTWVEKIAKVAGIDVENAMKGRVENSESGTEKQEPKVFLRTDQGETENSATQENDGQALVKTSTNQKSWWQFWK